jgi:TatD DNase family protein
LRALNSSTWMVLVGSQYKTSRRALDYSNKYQKGVYAAIGLHPMHLHPLKAEEEEYEFSTLAEDFNYDMYEQLACFEKTVAIGEIGLDYYHLNNNEDIFQAKAKQKEVFIKQLDLARNLKLPVIIHCRQAHDDMLEILKDYKKKYKNILPGNRSWGVMHCFSGNEDLAWQYFSLGLLVSFTGLVTFSRQWDDLLRKIPLDKFMIETDCPFMTPEPFRGKRNEPSLVKYVAMRISEVKGLTIEKISETTTNNAKIFFNL